jgi:hypothetical protein
MNKDLIQESIKDSVLNTVHDLLLNSVYNKVAIEIDDSSDFSNWHIVSVYRSIKDSVWGKYNVARSK